MEISTTTISRHSSFLYSKNLLLPRSSRIKTSNTSLITGFHNPNSNSFVLRRRPWSIAMPLQAQSSALGAPEEGLEPSAAGFVGENDLLIVGPGVLGRIVADKWRQEHPGCQISGLTMTTDHHDELIKIGISPSVWESKEGYQFPHVVFCAPPSRSGDYPGDVRRAASSWNGEGSFLFTSSSAAYDCNDNGLCDEDAASLVVAILKKKFRGRIFLGCDNQPLSRQDLMELVNRSGKFSKKFEGFTGTADSLGKSLNNSKTRAEIGWEPKYSSFLQFLGLSE